MAGPSRSRSERSAPVAAMTSYSRLLVLSLLWLAPLASGTKNGIVGFGIPLYPDLCCQACHDSLSSLYLTCTTFDDLGGDKSGMDMRKRDDMGGMAMMGMTSDDCRANNTAWLQTMAYCIRTNCDADGYPADKQAECFGNQALAGAPGPSFHDSLPSTSPTTELAADAVWLNTTSLVNKDLYYSTHGTLGEFGRSEYMHTRYSVALYLVVIGICLVCGLLAQATSRLPNLHKGLQTSAFWSRLQQLVFLPALFGSRRLEPLPAHAGYVPGRALSLFIAFYVVLNVIFSAVSFGSFQPNIYFLSEQFELCEYVGNRTGTLSLVNMSIAILFAGRNNVLIALTGWSQTTFLTLHRWTARVAAIQAVVHSIVYTLAYFEPGYAGASAYAEKASEPFYYWGIIATIAMCLAAGFAFLPLRTLFYEIFLLLHIAFVVVALVGCWYHLVPHFGFDYGYQVWLYICFAFWAADRLARLLRIGFYNSLGGSKATVETLPGCDDIMQITLFPRVTWGFGPAQHSFLYMPGLQGRFWESHPFSIAGWTTPGQQPVRRGPTSPGSRPNSDSDEKEVKVEHSIVVPAGNTEAQSPGRSSIRFLVRAHSGITSVLRRRLLSSPTGSSLELSVYTEGPYAGHRATLAPLLFADTVLCIAGGIGITHMLGLIQQYAQTRLHGGAGESQGKGRHAMKAKRFILAWSAREMPLIEHVKQNFLDGIDGVEFSLWCTGSSGTASKDEPAASEGREVKAGRMNIESVLRASAEVGQQTAVLVCAPGAMADVVTKEVVKCVKDGLRLELVEETFAW